MNYFYFADKPSSDFQVYITDAGVYATPERSYEKIEIPGRNGDLLMENNKYPNVEMTYPAIIVDDFDANFRALSSFLLSQQGYQKLYDSFHPDEYCLATFKRIDGLKHTTGHKAGTFTLVFDRKPQRFLNKGDVESAIHTGEIKNPTLYEALPKLRITDGYGMISINDKSVVVKSTPITIDCDTQEAYHGNTYKNDKIELENGAFPSLKAGDNTINIRGAFYKGTAVPTTSNSPASSWNTTEKKEANLGKAYYKTNSDQVYIWRKTSGVTVKFNDLCETEGTGTIYDYVILWYVKDGQWYESERLGGSGNNNRIAGREIFIPSNVFYMQFHTDQSQHDYYGYKIDSVTYASSGTNTFTTVSEQTKTWTEITVGTDALPESNHPYSDNLDDCFKVTLPGASGEYSWIESTWSDVEDEGLLAVNMTPRWWSL